MYSHELHEEFIVQVNMLLSRSLKTEAKDIAELFFELFEYSEE